MGRDRKGFVWCLGGAGSTVFNKAWEVGLETTNKNHFESGKKVPKNPGIVLGKGLLFEPPFEGLEPLFKASVWILSV